MHYSKYGTSLCLLFILSACGGGGGDESEVPPDNDALVQNIVDEQNVVDEYVTPAGVASCSVEDLNRRVDFDMRDYYIYYDQVPPLNINDFDSPEDLIRALRVDPDIYSNVQDAVTQTSQTEEGIVAGYGIWFQPAGDGVVRFRESRLGSPAHSAGIRRGDELVTLNGQPIQDLSDEGISSALAADSISATFGIRTGDEPIRVVSVVRGEYRWQTAGYATRFTSSSNPSLPVVGYIRVRAFLETTQEEINTALLTLRDEGGFEELVVDLRYNGGGRTRIARNLASVIGGAAVDGEVFLRRRANNKYPENNSDSFFDSVDEPLNLPRVFVLTTSGTASASEAFINGLEPYVDVVVIGDVTVGKPFTSFQVNYCDRTINAMSRLRTNAVGVSVLGGIQPDCMVEDDWQLRLNAVNDPLLDGALSFVVNGTCDVTMASASNLQRNATESGPSFIPEDPARFVSEQ